VHTRLSALDPELRRKVRLALTVNGDARELLVDGYKTLLEILREDLGLTGTKHGCELGECGACAVLLDGELVLSCLVAGVECQDRAVETIEAMQAGPELHPLQACFADHGAAQCGYCTPGFLLAARELLERRPGASRDQIAEALSGQLCRCTGYLQIFEAVEAAAKILRGENSNSGSNPLALAADDSNGGSNSPAATGAAPAATREPGR
jgi:aerobic-type carbon monoxide dehydrogenase small subunit (CoxS/CutS family)